MKLIQHLWTGRIILLFLIMFNCNSKNQIKTKNNKAHIEVEEKLIAFKNYLDGKSIDSTLSRIEMVYYFENLTSITSESDGNDLGKLNPTKNDYEKWKKWYDNNKVKIYWDEKEQKVKVIQ